METGFGEKLGDEARKKQGGMGGKRVSHPDLEFRELGNEMRGQENHA